VVVKVEKEPRGRRERERGRKRERQRERADILIFYLLSSSSLGFLQNTKRLTARRGTVFALPFSPSPSDFISPCLLEAALARTQNKGDKSSFCNFSVSFL
jgi:hypothetical protein